MKQKQVEFLRIPLLLQTVAQHQVDALLEKQCRARMQVRSEPFAKAANARLKSFYNRRRQFTLVEFGRGK